MSILIPTAAEYNIRCRPEWSLSEFKTPLNIQSRLQIPYLLLEFHQLFFKTIYLFIYNAKVKTLKVFRKIFILSFLIKKNICEVMWFFNCFKIVSYLKYAKIACLHKFLTKNVANPSLICSFINFLYKRI